MKQPRSCGVVKFAGAPCRIRTYDALIRSQVLYPAEVRALKTACLFKHSTVWVSTITLKTATECSRCAVSAPLLHSRRPRVVPMPHLRCVRVAPTPRQRRANVAPAPASRPRQRRTRATSHPQRYEPITPRSVRDADKRGFPKEAPEELFTAQPCVALQPATACGPVAGDLA